MIKSYYKQRNFEYILLTIVVFYSMSLMYQLRINGLDSIRDTLDMNIFSLIGLLMMYFYIYLKSMKLRRELDFADIQQGQETRKLDTIIHYFPYFNLLLFALSQINIGLISFELLFYSCLGIIVISVFINTIVVKTMCKKIDM